MGTEAWPYDEAILDYPHHLDLLVGYLLAKLAIIENEANDTGIEPDDTIRKLLENHYPIKR